MLLRKLFIFIAVVSILPLRAAPVADARTPIPVYVFAGQSNMVGSYAKTAELPAHDPDLAMPQKDVLFWGPVADMPRRWAALEPPTEVRYAVYRNGFGPELSAAKTLSRAHPGQQIAVFKYARNGTNLAYRWNVDNGLGLYHQMMSSLRYARTKLEAQTGRPSRIAGFFWMQGESDGATRGRADAYGRNLTKLIARIRSDARNTSLPVVIGRILDVRKWDERLPYSHIVRAKQYEVALRDPSTYLVSTDDLPQEIASKIHFDTKGTALLGGRMVQSRFSL